MTMSEATMTEPKAADPRPLRTLLAVCAALFAAPAPFFYADEPFAAAVLVGVALAHAAVLAGARGASLSRAALAAQVLAMVMLPLVMVVVALPSLL
jgi:hypothetical protein